MGIDFEPWAARIVAVVDVGGWNDRATTKSLQFTWSSVARGATEVPLFTQQVDVKPGQRAYATALSPGRLALGAYRVKVAVAGATETIDFYVALPAAEEPLTAVAVGKATSTTDPAATQASGLVRRRDGADSSVVVGEAPTAGEVGTAGEGQASEAPAQAGCVLSVSPSTEGESLVWASASGCDGDTLVLAVSNGGKEYDVPLAVASGEAMTPYNVDPCALGLAETTAVTVTYMIKVTDGPDKGKASAPYSGTRAPTTFDSPPGTGVDSSPPVGSFVATGDQIELDITASDDIKVSHLTVTADPPLSKPVDIPYSGKPRLCHATTDYRHAAISYTVPANPPEMITFTITVTDSAGQHQTVVAQYPTRGIWYGDLVGKISSAGPSFNCAGTFDGPIRVVVASSDTSQGPVDVTGDALVHANGFGCALPPNFPQTGDVTFTVTGTYDGKAFKLQLAPSGVENVAAFSVGLHLFSLPAPSLTIGAARSGSRTLRASSTFHRENSGPEELSGGGGSATLDGSLSMACCSPNAEPVVPAKAPPRFLGEDD